MTKEEKQALTARLFAEMPELPEPKVFRDTQELKYIPIDDYTNR